MNFCHSSHCHAHDCLCAMPPAEAEARRLSRSSVACAVADAWARLGRMPPSATFDDPLWATLNDLELATRESPIRKVK